MSKYIINLVKSAVPDARCSGRNHCNCFTWHLILGPFSSFILLWLSWWHTFISLPPHRPRHLLRSQQLVSFLPCYSGLLWLLGSGGSCLRGYDFSSSSPYSVGVGHKFSWYGNRGYIHLSFCPSLWHQHTWCPNFNACICVYFSLHHRKTNRQIDRYINPGWAG